MTLCVRAFVRVCIRAFGRVCVCSCVHAWVGAWVPACERTFEQAWKICVHDDAQFSGSFMAHSLSWGIYTGKKSFRRLKIDIET